jgi:hypothetical protein
MMQKKGSLQQQEQQKAATSSTAQLPNGIYTPQRTTTSGQ